jgi:glucose uptake protein
MILPAPTQTTLILLVFSMICWGSWANTQKLAGKWRFELYYYDFSLGFLLAAVAAAFTFGSWNSAELTFQENFLLTGYHNLAYALAAGMVFNFGNLFLTAAVSVSGVSTAFPIAMGLALSITTAISLVSSGQGRILLSVAGIGLALAAIALGAYAYSSHLDVLAESSKKAALQLDPRSKYARSAPKAANSARGIVLSLVSGIGLGLFRPLVSLAAESDNGVAPYGLALLFAGGIMATTVVLSPFFFNFPVAGAPVRFRDYFAGSMSQHLLGWLGGILAGAALLTSFLAAGAPVAARATPGVSFALNQAGAVLAALWGLLVWHERKGSGERIRALYAGMLVLLVAGIGMFSFGHG